MANKKRKIYKISIDRKACIGAATCIIVAPDAFELDLENKAIVRFKAMSLDDDTIFLAAQSCPTSAIILYNGDGKQIFPKSKS